MAKVNFLGSTITSQGMAPIRGKIDEFLKSLKIPSNVKQVRRFIGLCQFYKSYLPGLAEKLLPFYQLLRTTTPFALTTEHEQTFDQLRTELKLICETNLRLPKQELQYVILADASFYAAGYVLMIEEYPNTDSKNRNSTPQLVSDHEFFNQHI